VNIELQFLSGTQLTREYRKKRLSPVEVTKAILNQIKAYNEKLNAFRIVDEEDALAQAKNSEARWVKGEPKGLVDGVPVSIKDNIWAKGWPTLFGSKTIDPNQPWDEDAPSVARLREHGAIILGKTCIPEFAHQIVTVSPLTGVTRNPWNLQKSPGGSSGGAAAAVAMGMGPLAIGTDGGGSIRIPCHWSGVFGLKPTFGRVPHYPRGWYASLSHVGPITRTVEDAAVMMTIISEPDPRDWYALPPDGRDYLCGLNDGVKGLRIAYSPDLGCAKVDREVADLASKAVSAFSDLGAFVDQVDPPGLEEGKKIHGIQWCVHTAKGVRSLSPEKRSLLDPAIIQLAERGEKIGVMEYAEALAVREALGLRMNLFHEKYDLLVSPSFHVTAPDAGKLPEELKGPPPLTCPFNQTRQPAASIPCGITSKGLPVGLQIVGPLFRDDVVLRASRAYEAARGAFPLPTLTNV